MWFCTLSWPFVCLHGLIINPKSRNVIVILLSWCVCVCVSEWVSEWERRTDGRTEKALGQRIFFNKLNRVAFQLYHSSAVANQPFARERERERERAQIPSEQSLFRFNMTCQISPAANQVSPGLMLACSPFYTLLYSLSELERQIFTMSVLERYMEVVGVGRTCLDALPKC